MNKAGLRELIQTYNYLYKKDIFAYQLAIIDELECYIETDIPLDDYLKLYNEIECTYLKINVRLDSIVKCAVANMDKILNGNCEFNLKEESCWYK